ncbi:MAG TPA: hypothetical protein VIU62_14585, partial [Chloroflexota bacterium]
MAVREAERPATAVADDDSDQRQSSLFLGAEREQFRLASDLDAKGRYGQRWLVVTDRHVLLFDTDPDGTQKPALSVA